MAKVPLVLFPSRTSFKEVLQGFQALLTVFVGSFETHWSALLVRTRQLVNIAFVNIALDAEVATEIRWQMNSGVALLALSSEVATR